MKALILENDYELTPHTNYFLSQHDHLFTGVKSILNCIHQPSDVLIRQILEVDAIIIDSQFHNKRQLEQLTHEFVGGHLHHKNYRFFIFDIINFCNEWARRDRKGSPVWKKYVNKDFPECGFQDYDRFMQEMLSLVERGCIYNLMSPPKKDKSIFNCAPAQIMYHPADGNFYLQHVTLSSHYQIL